jgi:hypothetical protein
LLSADACFTPSAHDRSLGKKVHSSYTFPLSLTLSFSIRYIHRETEKTLEKENKKVKTNSEKKTKSFKTTKGISGLVLTGY